MAMKKVLSLLVLIIPLFCCTKVNRVDVAYICQNLDDDFVTDGKRVSFVKSITRQQVLSELNLPDDAQILSLDVSYLTDMVILKPDNVAEGAIIAANINVGGIEAPIVKETKITFDRNYNFLAVPIRTPLTSLSEEGISLLKNQINDWLHQYSSFDTIQITVFAAPDPVNTGKLSVEFVLTLMFTVNYQHCGEVPNLLVKDGMECKNAVLN
jgi:hypothetical protein